MQSASPAKKKKTSTPRSAAAREAVREPVPRARHDATRDTALDRAREASEPTRRRLLLAGLQLFAEQGYTKTSIRQIALAAGTNVASVSYHFGSKEGLYREVYWGKSTAGNPARGLPDSFDAMYRRVLEPLRRGAEARAWIRLQRREMLEPTGLWRKKVDLGIRPLHGALVALLCGRLGIASADDEVQALAMLVMAPAVHLLVNCEMIDLLAPQLLTGPDVVDVWCARLAAHTELLIAAERTRRAAAAVKPARTLRGSPSGQKPVFLRTSRSKA